MTTLSDDLITKIKVDKLIEEQDVQLLTDLINHCQTAIKTAKWVGNKKKGHKPVVTLIYELCTGIQYAKREQKGVLLEITGLKLELIAELVRSFGVPVYYSHKQGKRTTAVPYNLSKARQTLLLIANELGLATINKFSVTKELFDKEFEDSKVNAKLNHNIAQAFDL